MIEVAPTVPEVHPVTHVAALQYFGHTLCSKLRFGDFVLVAKLMKFSTRF
jgi:hypothetical protein